MHICKRLCCVVVAALAVGCASVAETPLKAKTIPVFPPPPEPARFIYERTLYSSADILEDASNDAFRRMVTGEKKVGEAFAKPYGVAVHQGNLYVSDTVRRVVMKFDLTAKRFTVIGTDDPGSVRLPLGLDVDAAGRLYVCDGTTKHVHVFDPNGKFVRQLAGAEWLKRPSGIAVEPSGERIYVVDTGGVDTSDHRVRVFDAAAGTHLFDIGTRGDKEGEFNLPRDVALAPNGNVYVVDGGNFRIQVFDRNGTFLRTFGSVGRQGGQFSRPKELAIDVAGNVYVVDAAFGNFQVFTSSGELLLDVGNRGNSDQPAKYMLPSGIAVDRDGRVYVADQYYRKVEVFRPASTTAAGSAVSPDGPDAAKR